mmetsp:Transcript_7425/g.20649  ORF Transcript_7425/g.20649 Transcript_7425/m.20649 type:complete len:209 (-) Transcript_7425:256-882(-)
MVVDLDGADRDSRGARTRQSQQAIVQVFICIPFDPIDIARRSIDHSNGDLEAARRSHEVDFNTTRRVGLHQRRAGQQGQSGDDGVAVGALRAEGERGGPAVAHGGRDWLPDLEAPAHNDLVRSPRPRRQCVAQLPGREEFLFVGVVEQLVAVDVQVQRRVRNVARRRKGHDQALVAEGERRRRDGSFEVVDARHLGVAKRRDEHLPCV